MKLQRLLSVALCAVLTFSMMSCEKDAGEPGKPDLVDNELVISSDDGNVIIGSDKTSATVVYEPVGGTVKIAVVSNLKWTVEPSSELSGWCTVSKSGPGIVINAPIFSEEDERGGTINIVADGETFATVEISQNGSLAEGGAILIEKYHLGLTDAQTETDLNVLVGTGDWDVVVAGEPVEWLTVTKSVDGTSLKVESTPNPGITERNAVITVRAKENGQVIATKDITVRTWKASLVFEVTTTEPNQLVYFPIKGTIDAKICWGDDGEFYETVQTEISPTVGTTQPLDHTYAEAGTYIMRLNGIATNYIMSSTSFGGDVTPATGANGVTKILQWGETGVVSMVYGFRRMAKLESVPDDTEGCLRNVTTAANAFHFCSALTTVGDLFAHASKVTTVANLFNACTSLETVDIDIFKGLKNVTTAMSAFDGCTKLTGTAPKLPSSPVLTSVMSMFRNTAITTIPTGFVGQHNFTDNVSSGAMSTLFSNTAKELTTVEAGAFDGLATSGNCFNMASVFIGCSKLKNIPENMIPEGITTVTNMFMNCTSLEEIPATLFSNTTTLTTVTSLFNGCTSLRTVPVSIFDTNKGITTFTSLFNNCTAIEGETPYTMVGDEKAYLWERTAADGFTAPTAFGLAFRNATFDNMEDVPTTWK